MRCIQRYGRQGSQQSWQCKIREKSSYPKGCQGNEIYSQSSRQGSGSPEAKAHCGCSYALHWHQLFDVVLEAMQKSAASYAMYGMQVQWYLSKGYNAQVQYNQLMKLKDKVNAIILMPINDECICQAIKALTDNGVFVVTINTDIENSTRNCYVGTDYFNGGCTAGAMLQLLHKGQLNVGITLGSLQILGHQQRLEGFRHILQSNAQAKILGIVEDQDDEILSYEKNLALLREHPEINALFAATSGGIYGACRAIMACQPSHDMTVVVFDNLPTTVELMEQGIVQATIYQHPRRQGQIAMQIVLIIW